MKIAELGSLDRPITTTDEDPERPRLLAYLRAGRVVQAARSLAEDQLDDQRQQRVPIVRLTDGRWIWSGAITYYADVYGIPVDPALVEHIRAQDFTMPEVTDAEVSAALTQLNQS